MIECVLLSLSFDSLVISVFIFIFFLSFGNMYGFSLHES